MLKTIMLLSAAVGAGVMVWLLTAAPDISSSYPHTQCHSVLGSDGSSVAQGTVSDGAKEMCATYQSRRIGWALVVLLPSVVLASAATRARSV
jgi:hypothetical protein